MARRTADDASMTLGEHLEELRRRIIRALIALAVCVGLSMIFAHRLIGLLKRPYLNVAAELNLPEDLVVLAAADAFVIDLRVGLLAGVILASPLIFYQLWRFVSAGLLPHERRYVMTAVPVSTALFIAGAAFFLLVVAEATLRFFLGFGKWLGVTPMITLRSHISFMSNLMLVFGLAFQMPLVTYLLARVGLVRVETFRKYRKHVVVGLLILSAAVTSPSPVDQVALAVPMWVLYEAGVLLARLGRRRRREAEP